MRLTDTLRKLLDLAEGYEQDIARAVSERTSVSQEQVENGIDELRDVVEDGSNDGDRP